MPQTSAPDLIGAPTADAVARFSLDLAALCPAASDRILVAVSGGPDSVALLLLSQALLGDRCMAATVDHGLRAESANEAAWAADLCARRGIPHQILRGALPDRAGHTGNVSARARVLRYRLLEEHAAALGTDWIATAHHADDQLETMIMRLNRSAGIAGLAGVRARTRRVIRPLLGWRRHQLVELVAACGIVPVDDPSNVNDRFDRARLRKALARIDWLDADRWALSARALGDAEDAIDWSVDQIETLHLDKSPGQAVLDRNDFPLEIRRRLIERAIHHVDPAAEIRGSALLRALRTLQSGGRTMVGNVVCDGSCGATWRFRTAPPRRSL